MTQNRSIRIPDPSISQMHLLVKKLRYAKAHNRLIGEDEIRHKIEIEIAFQAVLVAALDKEGYFVKNFKTPDEREEASIREKYENETDLSLHCWRCFRVYSKDASAPFRLTVWFSGDVPVPSTFNWRALDVEAVSVAGPSICKVSNGVLLSDASPSVCYHVSIIDARLCFEAMPLPIMRDTLLDSHLAEEMASKVAVAFDRIRAILVDRGAGRVSTVNLTQQHNRILVDGTIIQTVGDDDPFRP